MSEEMAVDGVSTDEPRVNGEETPAVSAPMAGESSVEAPSEAPPDSAPSAAAQSDEVPMETDSEPPKADRAPEATGNNDNDNDEFKGFNTTDLNDSTLEYSRVLDRLEKEMSIEVSKLTPVRQVTATPIAAPRANKRLLHETEGSRPSSAMSARSDGDGIQSSTEMASSAASSPAGRRRATATELASPLLRAPLENGWRRELVFRAALDAHSRRNADVYYYTPQGKKLRSTREISENLSGTGYTLDNFSFFKEPLGIDDPEKEIIRDAKLMRRMESPLSSPAPVTLEGKRTPKPKAPKGASPEPPASAAAKLKVKSVGSRLSGTNTVSSTTPYAVKSARKSTTTPSDNNNSASWKKTRLLVPPPPPLQSRPPEAHEPAAAQVPPQQQRPCSMKCSGARGAVPSLTCAVCLCLYHPQCVGLPPDHRPDGFHCKNCRSGSPPVDPPPLIHKSGLIGDARQPRRVPPTATAAATATATTPAERDLEVRRVLLRMKVSDSGPSGERVWSVARPRAPAPPRAPPRPAPRPQAPQGIVLLNGRSFIVVQRSIVNPAPVQHADEKRRGRTANGAASPPTSPPLVKRRGRQRADDTDYFTPFYNTSQQLAYNVVMQIFQYVGMRELAVCARVCRLWRELASTPALWRHVRMKNSQVNDWGGLCATLRKHGTVRLDLRKMLLPPNDQDFWKQFAQHIHTVDTLERIEMCRCPSDAVEAVCRALPGLRALSAVAVRDTKLDPAPLAGVTRLQELRLKSMAGLTLTTDLTALANLQHLQHLSLTSIKELGSCACDVVGSLRQLVSLELGECTFGAEFGQTLALLQRLQRLRLERGTAECAAPALLRALATLPRLQQLELVNFDVKVGFDDALAECRNVQRLLIIPTYVSQSATTNKQVLSGVLRLKDSLTHLMWGVTIELLRVTKLFIDQCEQGADRRQGDIGECIPVLKPVPGCRLPDEQQPVAGPPQGAEKRQADIGECIPVLKPVPGCRLPDEHQPVAGPPQVEILPLTTLQRLLSAQLPNTKLKLLRIPFHATWRQSLADFQ